VDSDVPSDAERADAGTDQALVRAAGASVTGEADRTEAEADQVAVVGAGVIVRLPARTTAGTIHR